MNDLTLARLADRIGTLHERTTRAAAQQINYWLTIRNWCIGWYIVEYEQAGQDRATYGAQLLTKLAERLKDQGVKGLSASNLKTTRQFYLAYPQIRQTVSGELQLFVNRTSALSAPAGRPVGSNN